MRELAVQASNGTLTSRDRESLQNEVSQLTSEIDRVSETTNFNGRQLLNGSGTTQLQVGASAGDTVQMNAIDTRTSRLGRNAQATATTTGSALQSGDLELNGVSVRATNASDDLLSTSMADQSGIALASAINSSTAASGVTATVNATTISSGAVQGGTLDANNSVTINDFTLTGFDVNASDGGDTLMDAINASADETGVTASRDQAGNLELVAQDGRNIVVETTGTASKLRDYLMA